MRLLPALLGALLLAGCIEYVRADVDAVAPADLPADTRAARLRAHQVRSPVRVHLADGSVVLFPSGAFVRADSVVGADALRVTFPDGVRRPVSAIALADAIGAEVYSNDVDVARTGAASGLATAAAAVAIPFAMVAIFGSCPTVYAATPADTLALEAELFSHSIAPLFEMRDRDVLRHARADADGLVRLEIRNEALESHYANHLALEAVDHPRGTRVVPADDGRVLVLADESAPRSATDRVAREVRSALSSADGQSYATTDAVTEAVSAGDLHDTVTLVFERPAGDEAALALRFRSSLLTSVLLYEHMLAGQGAAALDWLGRDLATIGTVAGFGRTYTQHLGLRVEVETADGFREVARVAEAGPVAWTERGVTIPLPPGPRVRVRLRFLAGGWLLDHVTLAAGRTATSRPVPLASVADDRGAALPDALAALARPDGRHAATGPGHAYHVAFAPPPVPAGQERTLLLSAQGYYTEWMRPDWLRTPDPRPFVLTDSTLADAVHTWRRERARYDRTFWATRLPVR